MGKLQRLHDLSPRKVICVFMLTERPVFAETVHSVFPFLGVQEGTVLGRPRDDEERQHAEGHGEQALKDEYPRPARFPAYPVHVQYRGSEQAAERPRQRRSRVDDGKAERVEINSRVGLLAPWDACIAMLTAAGVLTADRTETCTK